MTWGMLPGATMREIVATTQPASVPVGAQPIDRTRLALWLCYGVGCSWWNAPANTHCTKCGGAR
jgi:hypothetical protein